MTEALLGKLKNLEEGRRVNFVWGGEIIWAVLVGKDKCVLRLQNRSRFGGINPEGVATISWMEISGDDCRLVGE